VVAGHAHGPHLLLLLGLWEDQLTNEQPALEYLYQAIGRLRLGLDMEATRKRLWAMRDTSPSALAALTMPVLCITGEEDVVMPTPAIENLVGLLVSEDGQLNLDFEDEIIAGACITRDGEIVHEGAKEAAAA